MIEFSQPWAISFSILPIAVYMFLKPSHKNNNQAALKVPFFNNLLNINSNKTLVYKFKSSYKLLYLTTIWILLIIASMGPYWLGAPIGIPVKARNLMLAIDTSNSMAIVDMQYKHNLVSRMFVVKKIAHKFITERTGDRIGLILFGSQAYLQAPLTLDRKTVTAFLEETEVKIAGPQTAIGNAIGLAIKHLAKQDKGDKTLILLTDGVDNISIVSPRKMAQIAQESKVKIYTIGFGSNVDNNNLDEDSLRFIANTTGGQYFRATDTKALQSIYTQINILEPVTGKGKIFHHIHTLHQWPLAIAFLLSIIFPILKIWESAHILKKDF